jgi:2',3'-cyclic-nucleotide 2'-phosphodiesterase (5'-nucleotidase family)
VSAGEAMAVMPFGNELDVVTVKGKNIRDQLEISVKDWSAKGESGRFLQMAGLDLFKFDSFISDSIFIMQKYTCTFHHLFNEAFILTDL